MSTEILSLSPSEPFGPMVVGHALQIDFGVLREPPGEDEVPFDLSGSRFEIWIRARDAKGELVEGREKALTKVAGTGGFISDAYALGDDATLPLRWSIVRVDTQAEEGATDLILFAWRQAITASTP